MARFLWKRTLLQYGMMAAGFFLATSISFVPRIAAQGPPARAVVPKASKAPARPKLVVLLVVDQMRGDYVDKFLGQWTGGLKRLVEEGAWFRDAAYPYAATETCVGHATISTGAFPATHGMVANAWWDRQDQKMVTCTADPDPNVKNIGYAGATPKGADTATSARPGRCPSRKALIGTERKLSAPFLPTVGTSHFPTRCAEKQPSVNLTTLSTSNGPRAPTPTRP